MQVICSHQFAASPISIYPSALLPSVESSETILLRRLILRLINLISLFPIPCQTYGPPTLRLFSGEEMICFAQPCEVRWGLGTRIPCAIEEFQAQAGEGVMDYFLTSMHSLFQAIFSSDPTVGILEVYAGGTPSFVQIFVMESWPCKPPERVLGGGQSSCHIRIRITKNCVLCNFLLNL